MLKFYHLPMSLPVVIKKEECQQMLQDQDKTATKLDLKDNDIYLEKNDTEQKKKKKKLS